MTLQDTVERNDATPALPERAEDARKDLEEMEEEIAPFTERKKFSRESTGGGWRHESGANYDGNK